MKLSIVTTLYQSEPYIEEFCAGASEAARTLVGDDYEIVMVNDGSPDNSLDVAVSLARRDTRLVVVDLSRNFGHHKAMMTGLDHARGDLVFLIDSDLEEDPAWLTLFHEALTAGDHDVVYGVQSRRKGNWWERTSGSLFYTSFNALSGVELPRNLITARLMRRRYVSALLQHREREVVIAGLWQITGFDQHALSVNKKSTSRTTYSVRRKLSVLVNSVTSFSNAPLVMIFNTGVVISIVASIYIAYLVFNWAFLSRPLSGWTSLMGSIWLLGGLIISFIGIIGLYLAKIFTETKQRPYTIVRHIYGRNDE
ncbi:glycosyltransferase family 2 protein [uncultured Roseobacter sp.]|uniref:glycosyltransferase family 2 protein n=1 Tax=uncultured Roseobacter sp. TaxID=114847 RepID=UPI002624DC79|nr:glycosyltransferase family 2 protein [uncultured Roseobacter sp.]